MDLRLPGTDGATATALINALSPPPRVLVLTTYDSDADILRAMAAGASGYLLKDTPREALLAAIRAAAKLDVDDRTAAVTTALAQHLITLPPTSR